MPPTYDCHEHDDAVHLLWTGGWDSTFELLDLVLRLNRPVRPFYLIDAGRRSTRAEMRAMNRIRAELFAKHRHTKDLIRPTVYWAVDDIPDNGRITQAYKRIRLACYIGSQYEWLARFCHWRRLSAAELCIHVDDRAHIAMNSCTVMREGGGRDCFVISNDCDNPDIRLLFGCYVFPVLGLSKMQMQELAVERGWDEIMSQTWFCHRPTVKQAPCGRCSPCLYALEEGMGWRIPRGNRLLGYLYRQSGKALEGCRGIRRQLAGRLRP